MGALDLAKSEIPFLHLLEPPSYESLAKHLKPGAEDCASCLCISFVYRAFCRGCLGLALHFAIKWAFGSSWILLKMDVSCHLTSFVAHSATRARGLSWTCKVCIVSWRTGCFSVIRLDAPAPNPCLCKCSCIFRGRRGNGLRGDAL